MKKKISLVCIGLGVTFLLVFLFSKSIEPDHLGRTQNNTHKSIPSEHTIAVYSSGGLKIQTLGLKLEKFPNPISIEVPGISSEYDRSGDGVVSSYVAACNPVSTAYEEFVKFTTVDYRILTNRNDRQAYQSEMVALVKVAAEKKFSTTTRAVLLYKIFVTGDFGEVCFLVKLPSLLTIDDVGTTPQEDLTFVFFRKIDDLWILDSPSKTEQLGLGFLDYKNTELIDQILNSSRVTLDSDGQIAKLD